MDTKLSALYYSPKGYWKGIGAIKKLAAAAGVSEDAAKEMAQKTGHLADLPAPPKAHSTPKIWRDGAERGPPGRPALFAP